MITADPTVASENSFERPLVGRAISGRGPWLFGAALLAGAIVLFTALEARRADLSSPAIPLPRNIATNSLPPPPDLVIPPEFAPTTEPFSNPSAPFGTVLQPDSPSNATIEEAAQPPPRPAPLPRLEALVERPPPQRVIAIPQETAPVLRRPQPTPALPIANSTESNRPTRIANPGLTVPMGTVIHAVLETALDSNRAGAARAIVSRDVSSFDGTRILVPKGSKLLGQYEADLARGQNRALIQWNRLLLPDGVIIEVDSPSSDTLGRAGVKGKVNSHFFERFGGAILQSILDLGVQAATREVGGDTVVVALPGAARDQVTRGDDVKPTLKIRHGSSVSVFVARDLEFLGVYP